MNWNGIAYNLPQRNGLRFETLKRPHIHVPLYFFNAKKESIGIRAASEFFSLSMIYKYNPHLSSNLFIICELVNDCNVNGDRV